jgi:hypothetical protein
MSFLAFLDMVALKLTFRRPDVSAYESEAREGMDNIAEAIRTLAGSFCMIAAGAHSDTEGRQREMGAVFYADATRRFEDIIRKMDPKLERELSDYIEGICKGKQKR